MSPVAAFRDRLESGPLKVSTRAVSLKDEGVRGSGRATSCTGESSELPKYVSCSKANKPQAQVQEVINYKEGPWHSTHTYQVDDDRKPLE
jgi:hypothetical protein